mgnify:CR=1 FL=1|tara:strand:- start:31 stop:360 length:330 start_codon:yes stop_codon:yes gene_type:complete
MAQTVEQVLAAATISVNIINGINTDGKDSIYAGALTDISGNVTTSTWSQSKINEWVQRNVDHLTTILSYNHNPDDDTTMKGVPNIVDSSVDKSSYTAAITTGNAYIAAN